MRGKAFPTTRRDQIRRITPAYAGKRLTLHKIWQTVRDHPRLCGEKSTTTQSYNSTTGSTPPMRGKGDIEEKWVINNRISPAYAGKSSMKTRPTLARRDHPRLCGEKFAIAV